MELLVVRGSRGSQELLEGYWECQAGENLDGQGHYDASLTAQFLLFSSGDAEAELGAEVSRPGKVFLLTLTLTHSAIPSFHSLPGSLNCG